MAVFPVEVFFVMDVFNRLRHEMKIVFIRIFSIGFFLFITNIRFSYAANIHSLDSHSCLLCLDLQITGSTLEVKIRDRLFRNDNFCSSSADNYCLKTNGSVLRVEGVVSSQEFQAVKKTEFGEFGRPNDYRRNFIAGDFTFSLSGTEEFISLETWGTVGYKSFEELLTDFVAALQAEIKRLGNLTIE